MRSGAEPDLANLERRGLSTCSRRPQLVARANEVLRQIVLFSSVPWRRCDRQNLQLDGGLHMRGRLCARHDGDRPKNSLSKKCGRAAIVTYAHIVDEDRA